jgi:hypothetical protein
MARSLEDYDKAIADYDSAINEIVADINAAIEGRKDEDARLLNFTSALWAAAGDPSWDESLGRCLSEELVKFGLHALAARIDALLEVAPWREQPPLVEHPVHPDNVRILDEDWPDGQWPEIGRVQCDGKTYTFGMPLPNPNTSLEEQKGELRFVAARAINFAVARLVES